MPTWTQIYSWSAVLLLGGANSRKSVSSQGDCRASSLIVSAKICLQGSVKEKCALVCATSSCLKQNERKWASGGRLKSFKKYSRIIVQLTFSFSANRRWNPRPHSLVFSVLKWPPPLHISSFSIPQEIRVKEGCLPIHNFKNIQQKYKNNQVLFLWYNFPILTFPLFVCADLIHEDDGWRTSTWISM